MKLFLKPYRQLGSVYPALLEMTQGYPRNDSIQGPITSDIPQTLCTWVHAMESIRFALGAGMRWSLPVIPVRCVYTILLVIRVGV